MSNNDRINDYINSHLRECLFFLVIGISFVWQSGSTILALLIYVLFTKINGSRLLLFGTGLIAALLAIYYENTNTDTIKFLVNGFHLNFYFWSLLFQNKVIDAFVFMCRYEFIYILGCPLLLAGIVSFIDLISNSPHEKMMKALQKGIHPDDRVEVKNYILSRALKNLKDEQYDGTVLGVSKYTGKYVVMPDSDVNQVVLVLGTTGSGKTITLRRFYKRALIKGHPLIIVDGKPDEANIEWIKNLANQNGRPFFGFNCANKLHYDPLANGGFTELKDKIICLKDEWENDYYRSIAEDYLQTTFQVLLKSGLSLDLKRVVECLSYKDLVKITHATQDESLMKRVQGLGNYDLKDITGLRAHLNILIHSELGEFFENNQLMFSLNDVINKSGIVYFALPALRFPSFSKVLGKLVINDIKAVVDRQNNNHSIFTIFDEFSVFSGEQVLNLVNMGRSKGVHAIFGTQGLGDLDRVDIAFKEQILNCVNTLICHRLNDQNSAEMISGWIGTQNAFAITAQLNGEKSNNFGSVRTARGFIVHPDVIKQALKIGEAIYVTKVKNFKYDKIKIIYKGKI